MTLTPGARLGPYEVAALLGEGGMGQVYRATDTKLKRQVAIKILPPSVAADHDRLARFQREAEVLASLNHPNIAAIHGLEESDPSAGSGQGGTQALIMEFVDGPTLADRIARGPMPLDEALPIAKQIAEALEAAHEQGIIHRDLKPANVKVRPDGTVKVLDFGLAKALDPAQGSRLPPSRSASAGRPTAQGDITNSPTITSPAVTQMGMILGTAAYMSPEQARGKAVDKRSDIWAFGAVLYEMLTGKRLFSGEDVSETMAAVLRQTIAFEVLPEQTPAGVRGLIERCLERDLRQRLRDIGEARVSLERMLLPGGRSEAQGPSTREPPSRARTLLPWLLFATTAAALAAVVSFGRSSTSGSPAPVTRFRVGIGVPGSLAVDAGPAAVLSPDGRTVVLRVRHEGTTRLYARRLDQLAPVELAGSEQAANPFFSADGSRVGFFASGALKTMPLAGGAVTTLTDASTGRGAAWDDNGDILFQPSVLMKTPLVRITASGASTGVGTTLDADEMTHRWPQFLSGRVLYSAHTDVSNWDTGTLRIETRPGEPGKIVLRGGYHGRYVPTGHLLYVHAGTLYGVRFDLDRLETTSSPVPVIEHIAATPISGSAQYSVASDGTLAYIQGSTPSADARIHWLNPRGETSALKTTPGTWASPRFSPDGKRIALQVASGSHDQIAVYDLATDRLTQLTFDASNHRAPIWTPDSQRVVYGSDASGPASQNLYSRRADGSGDAERLTTSPGGRQNPYGVHPSGRYLLYSETQGAAPSILWILPLDGRPEKGSVAATPRPFSNGGAFDGLGAFSADGRLVAFMSNAQGPFEIYVRPFEGGGGPWRVSTSGGAHPTWSRSSNELLFTTEDQIMTARYRYDGKTFTSEAPRPWSPLRYATAGPIRKFDLHPDGTRAVVAGPDTTGATPYDTVVFVQNFFAELQRLLPAGR